MDSSWMDSVCLRRDVPLAFLDADITRRGIGPNGMCVASK